MTNIGSIIKAGMWMAVSALLMLATFEPVAMAPKHQVQAPTAMADAGAAEDKAAL